MMLIARGTVKPTFVPSSPRGHLCGELLFHAADLSDRLGSWVDFVSSKVGVCLVWGVQPPSMSGHWTEQETRYVLQGPALKLYASHPAHSIKGSPSPALVGVQCGHTPTP